MLNKMNVVLVAAATLVGSITLGAAAPSAADAHARSIPAQGPQHFITYRYDVPKSPTMFQYTVQSHTPISVDNIYYAQYVFGVTSGTGYYSGIQPHPNGTVNVRYSFFGAGAEPADSHCHAGADGGPGVTCAYDGVPYEVGAPYTIISERTIDASGRATYTGWLDDGKSPRQRVGAWRVPYNFAGFSSSAVNFIEKFGGMRSCDEIPAVDASYTAVSADGQPIPFTAASIPATHVPGEGIYTCANVSSVERQLVGSSGYHIHSSVG